MRFLAVLFFGAAAFAQEQSLFHPETLKWQAEAQERERTLKRRIDWRLQFAPKISACSHTDGVSPAGCVRTLQAPLSPRLAPSALREPDGVSPEPKPSEWTFPRQTIRIVTFASC